MTLSRRITILEPRSPHIEVGKASPDATDTPPSQGRRIRASRTDARRRAAVVVASLALSAFYLALIFAALWHPDFHTTSRLYTGVSLAAFYIDTFAFHGGIGAAVLVVFLAVWRRWRLCLAGLPAVVFTVGPSVLRYVPHNPPTISGDSVTVMTVNLFGANRRMDRLVGEIAEADPDILLLQEYNDRWHEALQSAVGDRYPHIATLPRRDFYGLAVYSKLRFEGAGPTFLYLAGLTVPCMKASVRIGRRPVTVFNVHLVPPKGVECFRQQGAQFADLLETIAAEPNPVVLAGDFNFTARARFADRMRHRGLRTCHDLAGWGRGATWPVDGFLRYGPGFRIDHVYLGPDLTCSSCRTGVGVGSDHRPIVAVIGLAE